MGRVEELSFPELVQELSHDEHQVGPPDLERSIRRRSLDARLLRLLCVDGPVDERRESVRVPGELPIQVVPAGAETLTGTLIDLGQGGMRVHVAGAGALPGDRVEVALAHAGPPARVAARVQWQRANQAGLDLGLHLEVNDEAGHRRLRRLVLEILRQLPDPLH